MKVLVTGGTGFVGSHAVQALAADGHEIRLFARSAEKVERVLGARGVRTAEVVVGDMTDAASVRESLEGCAAVLHAAAAVKFQRRSDIFEANLAGARNVLGTAVELGVDPVVYISSIAVFFPPSGPVVTLDDPLASPTSAYGRSKTHAERYARDLQQAGAPLVAIYPCGVYGPDDPGLVETTKGLRDRLKYGWLMTTGGNACVDVRDVARIITAVMKPGKGPRRYMAGGHFLTWAEDADLCEELTGRKVRRYPGPPALIRGIGRAVDFVKMVFPSFDYPLTYDASLFVVRSAPCESRATTNGLGIEFRPPRETLGDAIRWLVEAGHLQPKFAPKLAPSR